MYHNNNNYYYCKAHDVPYVYYRKSTLTSNLKDNNTSGNMDGIEVAVTGRYQFDYEMKLIKEMDCHASTLEGVQYLYQYDTKNRISKIDMFSNVPHSELCEFSDVHINPVTYEFIYDDVLRDMPWDLHKAITKFDRTYHSVKIKHKRNQCFSNKCKNRHDEECYCGFDRDLIYDPDGEFDYDDVKDRFPEYRIAKNYYLEEDDVYKNGEFLAMPSRNFWISPYETTQGEFAKIMGFNPSHHQACGTSCPVENVTWYQALAYANALSAQDGYQACYLLDGCTSNYRECSDVQFVGLDCNGYRLPTDEEWRFTAKQIRDSVSQEYLEENSHLFRRDLTLEWSGVINYEGGYITKFHNTVTRQWETHAIGPHSVGELAPLSGLYDFYGNVYEWIWDWFGYAKRAGDSLGADRGYCRIIRGGSVYSYVVQDEELMSHGDCYLPNRGGSVLGFRLVRTVAGYHSYPELADYEYGEITDW